MSDHLSKTGLARRTVIVASIVIAMGALVATAYVAATALFLIFAALILAAIFDGAADGLERLGLNRKIALVLIFFTTLGLIFALFFLGGASLFNQAQELFSAVAAEAERLIDRLQDLGLPIDIRDVDPQDLGDMLPAPGGILASAGNALFALGGWIGNLFVIFFLAAFVVWQPRLYTRGIVSLFPKDKRARLAYAIERGAHNLKMWLLGQGISMLTVFAVSWIGLWAIGMPYAFLLALQAGLLAFVPTLGAFIAGLPIILTGLSVSPGMALAGLAVYVVIQGAESNISTPIAQRWASSLPPALTLSVQLVFGLLFGLAGFLLAVPLVAVVMVLVQMLYVEDVLGGPVEGEA